MIFKGNSNYNITNNSCLMYADIIEGETMAEILYHSNPDFIGRSFPIYGSDAIEISVAGFARENNLSDDEITGIISRLPKKSIFDTTLVHYWTDKNSLISESETLLHKYGYKTSYNALSTIIKSANSAKSWIDVTLSKHPNYIDGKHYVVLRRKFHREYNNADIREFFSWFSNRVLRAFTDKYEIKENEIASVSFDVIKEKYQKVTSILNSMRTFPDASLATYDGNGFSDYNSSREYCEEILAKYREFRKVYDKWLSKEDFSRFSNLQTLMYYLVDQKQIMQPYAIDQTNKTFPSKTKFANEGQKTSRVVGKIAKEFGIDKLRDIQTILWIDDNGEVHTKEKDMGWNYQYAKYCDAVNPTEEDRWIVISVNPIDYWTMSFGHKWASCHTIDKENLRSVGEYTYEGCYSSGTESYMLDSSTIIVYLVDGKFNGTDFELEDKMKRCNFHIGEDKIVQGRVYPDGRDGGDEDNIAKEMREIVQEVFAYCCDAENKWVNKRGSDACYEAIEESYGKTNYSDYFHYDDCNVSYLKSEKRNMKKITVGHAPICPCCGDTHHREDNICCDDCTTEIICNCCGCVIDRDDFYHTDEYGNRYCDECVTFCEYHSEYEANNDTEFYYVEGVGMVCQDALDDGDFYIDDYDGCVYEINGEEIYTENGFMFSCEKNAKKAGYYYDEEENEWRREND